MGYNGEQYYVSLAQSGYNYNRNVDQTEPNALVGNTNNVSLVRGGVGKRGGTSHVNGTAIVGTTPRNWGTYQYKDTTGTFHTLTAMSTGKIYTDYVTEISTGLTIDRPVHFVTFNGLCIICTGNNTPHVWNGTGSTSALASVPTDWATNFPKKMITHGRGVVDRLWAIGGKTKPYIVYASDQSAQDGVTEPDFSDLNVYKTVIDTADNFGILNGFEYGDRIVFSGKDWMYTFDDSDTDTAKWGYNKAQWQGGTASDRLIAVVENDIVSMTEEGVIYSVTTAQTYGDYKRASLTSVPPTGEPFIDKWIADNVNMSLVQDFHMTYDQADRCLYIFVVRKGKTYIDTALCYYIDRGTKSGWTIKGSVNFDSGFKCSCSAVFRKSAGVHKVYTGGWNDGFVWELETASKNDNGNPYSSGFKLARNNFGNPLMKKRFDSLVVVGDESGGYTLYVNIYVDDKYIGQKTISLLGGSAVYDTAIYGQSVYAGGGNIETSIDIGYPGKRIQYYFFNNSLDEDFFITQQSTKFMPLSIQC